MCRDGPPTWRSVPAFMVALYCHYLKGVYLYNSSRHLILLYKIFILNEFQLNFHREYPLLRLVLYGKGNGKMMKGFLFGVDK
jgi:hypothetical protein